MKLDFQETIDFPPDRVFEFYRDRLADYIEYVPNITAIEITDREELDEGRTRLNVVWHGLGQIPERIRRHLKPEMICWRDHELWDPGKMTCEWTITPFYFTEFVNCRGTWRFEPAAGGGTRLRLDGVFEIDIKSWPGVPKGLLRFASKLIERMISGYVEPNLKANIDAVRRMLDEESRAAEDAP